MDCCDADGNGEITLEEFRHFFESTIRRQKLQKKQKKYRLQPGIVLPTLTAPLPPPPPCLCTPDDKSINGIPQRNNKNKVHLPGIRINRSKSHKKKPSV